MNAAENLAKTSSLTATISKAAVVLSTGVIRWLQARETWAFSLSTLADESLLEREAPVAGRVAERAMESIHRDRATRVATDTVPSVS